MEMEGKEPAAEPRGTTGSASCAVRTWPRPDGSTRSPEAGEIYAILNAIVRKTRGG